MPDLADMKADSDAVEKEPGERKQSGALIAALIAAAVCGAAGAASYFLTPFAVLAVAPTGAGNTQARPEVKKVTEKRAEKPGHGEKKGHAKTKAVEKEGADGGEGSTFFVAGETGVFVPRPIIVTLKPQGRIRYLKVGIAVETTPESEDVFVERELRIIDILTSYLRAVPVSAIEDPIAMARIREQLARRVAFIVEPAPVNAVLITDFILS